MSYPFHLRIIRDELNRRIDRNPSYSLRSFANALAIDAGGLSKIIAQKNPLTHKMGKRILANLDLGPKDASRFLESITKERVGDYSTSQQSQVLEIEQDKFSVIADWYHFAILESTFLTRFKSDVKWIARFLGINVMEARAAIDRLTKLGLMKMVSGKYKKIESTLVLQDTSQTSKALKRHQRQVREKAIESLLNDPIDSRHMFSMTIPTNPRKVKQARELIEQFRMDMNDTLTSGKKETLMQLTISLFPIGKEMVDENKK